MIDAILLGVAQILAGWLIADFLGGTAHWLEDRVLTEATPIVSAIVAANRLHHRDPMAFASRSLIERNGATWALVAIVALVWLVLLGPSLTWAAATAGGAVTSIVHYHAHCTPPAGSWLRTLQDIGIIQSSRQHAQHHRPPSDRRYCALTDWLNPVIDRLGLWAALERLIPLRQD